MDPVLIRIIENYPEIREKVRSEKQYLLAIEYDCNPTAFSHYIRLLEVIHTHYSPLVPKATHSEEASTRKDN